MGQPVFVIGNGESRRDYNWSNVQPHPRDQTSIANRPSFHGCNLSYQNSPADYVFAADLQVAKMVRENFDPHKLFTRPEHLLDNSNTIYAYDWIEKHCDQYERDLEPRNWGTGQLTLIHTALIMQIEEIYMVGFDLWPHVECKNNMFQDVEHNGVQLYKPNPPVDPRLWIRHSEIIFAYFPNTTFWQVQPDSWKPPQTWKQYPNFKQIEFDNIKLFK
jgi:hypothetical protein